MKKLLNEELNRLTLEEYKASKKIPVMVVLDNIRSQNNIGSIFRTADAFRLEGIYLCGITATPPHREIHKTALGATDSVHWVYYETTKDAIVELKKKGYRILSVEQVEGALRPDQVQLQQDQRCALVFGNEIRGVGEELLALSDGYIEIPQFGTKHSLNISVAAGIVIWEAFKQFPM